MKLSRTCGYALWALLELAAAASGHWVTAPAIARSTRMPERFFRKQLERPARAGLVVSWTGPTGGYRVARPAGAVTPLEVVEVMDGPIRGGVPLTDADARIDGRLLAACNAAANIARLSLGSEHAAVRREQRWDIRFSLVRNSMTKRTG
jgi:Rrf2 family protein